MRIATFNINSVRLRLPLVLETLEKLNLDILCLQETKVEDSKFPLNDFAEAGYGHTVFCGQKAYHGVAIISRVPLKSIKKHKLVNTDARHIGAIIPGDIELHNFYIPAGGDEPDVDINPKYKHKLEYVEQITEMFKKECSSDQKLIAVGDFNIAPLENDVWSHKQLLKVISHTPPETERLAKMKDSLNWVDVSREFVPENEKLYSWWSYRNRDWRKSNRGRRLDHIWVTSPLKESIKSTEILKDWRDVEKPSDHVPVVMELNI